MLKYKGYTGYAEIDFDTHEITGYVLDLNDVITFEGHTPEEVEKEFRKSVDVYLALCKEKGIEPAKPFSGIFSVRITPDLHKRISIRAAGAQKSLNQWVADACEYYLEWADKAPSTLPRQSQSPTPAAGHPRPLGSHR